MAIPKESQNKPNKLFNKIIEHLDNLPNPNPYYDMPPLEEVETEDDTDDDTLIIRQINNLIETTEYVITSTSISLNDPPIINLDVLRSSSMIDNIPNRKLLRIYIDFHIPNIEASYIYNRRNINDQIYINTLGSTTSTCIIQFNQLLNNPVSEEHDNIMEYVNRRVVPQPEETTEEIEPTCAHVHFFDGTFNRYLLPNISPFMNTNHIILMATSEIPPRMHGNIKNIKVYIGDYQVASREYSSNIYARSSVDIVDTVLEHIADRNLTQDDVNVDIHDTYFNIINNHTGNLTRYEL